MHLLRHLRRRMSAVRAAAQGWQVLDRPGNLPRMPDMHCELPGGGDFDCDGCDASLYGGIMAES